MLGLDGYIYKVIKYIKICLLYGYDMRVKVFYLIKGLVVKF